MTGSTNSTKHVLSFSGGKDSTAMYLRALELGVDFLPVFADTGNEHSITLEYVRTIHEKTGGPQVREVKADFSEQIARKRNYVSTKWEEKGVPPEIVERALAALIPTGIPFLDLCIWKGRFPSRKAAFCSEELKRNPMIEQIQIPLVDAGNLTIAWLGIRADESLRRSKDLSMERLGPKHWNYRPILNWTVEDVFAIHRRHDVEPNPLYSLGMGRVGCLPCINARKNEIHEIATRFPEEIERIKQWESAVAEASKRGASTMFAAATIPPHMFPDEGDTRANIDNVVAWAKTSRGGKQLDLFKAAEPLACSSLYGLCE